MTRQQCTPEATVLSGDLRSAIGYTDICGASSVTESLIEIGLYLVRSSPSMSLALPAALATKARCLLFTGSSLEFQALRESLLNVLKDRRRNNTFVQHYRDFCSLEDLGYRLYQPFEDVFREDMRSVFLLGIETETHLLNRSPGSCVSALVDEQYDFGLYLEYMGRHEEACGVWAQVVRAPQSCQCNPECRYRTGAFSQRLPSVLQKYANSLMETSRIEESLEQYKAALDAAPRSDNYSVPYFYLQHYVNALIKAERIEESYNVLHQFVESAKPTI